MTNKASIVFGKPHIGEEEIRECVESLRSGWLGTGPKVDIFRERFREYVGADHAEPVSSCTAALFLTQLALGIGKGDAVITTPLTFVSTANSVIHAGATPLFADVESSTGLIDPQQVERLLAQDCTLDKKDGRPIHRATGAKVRAILPVHLWGQPTDVASFRALCEKYNLFLIEDAAHAIEASYAGKKVGTLADATCFSFYATKSICTGEGGMVTTNNAEIAQRIRILAHHGLSHDAWKRHSDDGFRHYLAVEVGWKFSMMDLQAALGIHQLERIEKMYAERTRQWHAYRSDLAGLPSVILPPAEAEHGRHARHLFALRLSPESGLHRDSFMEDMHQQGVGTGVHYLSLSDHPVHRQAMNVSVPHAESLGRETVSIPLGGALTEKQRRRVVKAVKIVCKRAGCF